MVFKLCWAAPTLSRGGHSQHRSARKHYSGRTILQCCRDHNSDFARRETRRSALRGFLGIAFAGSLGLHPGARVLSQSIAAQEIDLSITHTVFFDISVNGQKIGRLLVGLFGKAAPNTVADFLSYIPSKDAVGSGAEQTGVDDQGFSASYRQSQFFRKDPETLLLDGGRIRNLQSLVLPGGEVYFEYFGKLTKAKPQTESNSVPHDRRGLLTRQLLQLGPEFSITMSPSRTLDANHTVFGEIIEGQEVLDAMDALPVRTDRSMEPEGSLADNVFRFQKQFFLELGQKVFRDQRALDTYPGKLLRRVTVSGCGVLAETSGRR